MGPVKFALLVFYEEFNGLKLRVEGSTLRVTSCGLRVRGCWVGGGVGRSEGERVRSLDAEEKTSLNWCVYLTDYFNF